MKKGLKLNLLLLFLLVIGLNNVNAQPPDDPDGEPCPGFPNCDSVYITSPLNGTVYDSLQQIEIMAGVHDIDTSIIQVEFFIDGVSIGVDISAPFSANWIIPSWGSYTLTAIGMDNDLYFSYSSPVVIEAIEPDPPCPGFPNCDSVYITSPSNGTIYDSLQQIEILTGVIDDDSSIIQVEFFINGTSIGVDNSSPFSINWTIPAWGSYTITATGIDNELHLFPSSPINIEAVEPDPPCPGFPNCDSVYITSPSNGTIYDSLQQIEILTGAIDDDSSIIQVEFFINGTSIGVDNSSPFSINWTIPAWGSYTITATGIDNELHLFPSSPINIEALEPDPGCTTVIIDEEDFESGWGIWNDGGSDCRRNIKDSASANSGNFCVRLRGNSSTSNTRTDVLDLSNFEEIKLNFSYIARSMDNPNEDFWLQISTDGGLSFTTVEEWNLNDEFVNDVRQNDSVTINGPFSSNIVFRFVCDASGKKDYVYLDDILITGCTTQSFARTNKIHEDKEESSHNDGTGVLSEDNMVMLYPNPATDYLVIDGKLFNGTLTIYSLSGAIVYKSTFVKDNKRLRIDVGHLPKGFYMIDLQSKHKRIYHKFLKE